MMAERIIIKKAKNEIGEQGYQIRINGRPVQIAMGEKNWFPKKPQAINYARQCRR